MSLKKSTVIIVAISSLAVGASAVLGVNYLFHKTSENESCMSCHVHTVADAGWMRSYHYNNESGTKTDCATCHLPKKGTFRYFKAKTKAGAKDIWSYFTKDKSEINWDAKKDLDYASGIVFNESCKECHVNLLPTNISDDGITAHLYYEKNEESLNLQCISCHLDAGHYNPNYKHSKLSGVPDLSADSGPVFESACSISNFANYTETVPGTRASISMIAVPGGTFTIGSPESEYGRKEDEGPQKQVSVTSFFMGEVEVTWDQYWAFYGDTMSEGRIDPSIIFEHNSRDDIDAVSGPTPPFGAPDQSWGMGKRPAITMTHYAASTFCQWLSMKTGKKYRLPTEAEWEYAARGGTSGPYFFEGNARKYSRRDTTSINGYVIYAKNSWGRSQEPSKVKPNPFGLKNMLGNVMEYCSDWYAKDAYSRIQNGQTDPKGPQSGEEHVVRGGLYSSEAPDLRCAARGCTQNERWLRTDPQNPKSIWWYSDIKGIGFRVVCELPENIK